MITKNITNRYPLFVVEPLLDFYWKWLVEGDHWADHGMAPDEREEYFAVEHAYVRAWIEYLETLRQDPVVNLVARLESHFSTCPDPIDQYQAAKIVANSLNLVD